MREGFGDMGSNSRVTGATATPPCKVLPEKAWVNTDCSPFLPQGQARLKRVQLVSVNSSVPTPDLMALGLSLPGLRALSVPDWGLSVLLVSSQR